MGAGQIFKRKFNHIYSVGVPPPWTQGISSLPQGLLDLVFQQSRPGTSGRAAEKQQHGGSWERERGGRGRTGMAPGTHIEV